MREIKFRAWDVKNKKYWVDEQGDGWNSSGRSLYITPNGMSVVMMGSDGGKDGLHEHHTAEGDSLVLEQFTGLKDKNDRDIYEGDILKIFNEHYPVTIEVRSESRVEVQYGYGGKHNGPAPHWVEIVGNIHENPELLK